MQFTLNLTGFLTSILLVCLSSLFFAFSVKDKKLSNTLIYAALIAISQVIISFEALSLFKAIYPATFLRCNTVFFAIATALWLFKNKPVPDFTSLKQFFHRVFNSLKSDKILLFLAGLFCFSVLISLFFVIFMPTNNSDSLLYRLPRVAFWINNASLGHYETTSLRCLVFPVNSELMLLWSMLFVKRDYFALVPTFFSYFGCLALIGVFLNSLKVSIKRILWVMLIVGSLPVVFLEASTTQSDLFVGILLMSSFYLFYTGIKDSTRAPIVFSALAYAVAIGAKVTAILFIPVFIIVFSLILFREKKAQFFRVFFLFISCLIPAFLLFSSYNYVLNYINYGNAFGPSSIVNEHTFPGLKYFFRSVILYLTYFADFSGIEAVKHINQPLINLYSSLNITEAVNIGNFSGFNSMIQENFSSFGILGYLLILPCTAFALTKIRSHSTKSFYTGICGVFLILFVLIMALIMGFSVFNFRYLVTAMVLAAPVLVFSYCKKPGIYKILITLVVTFNYAFIPLFMYEKPFFKIIALLLKYNNFNELRRDLRLKNECDFSVYFREYYLLEYLKKVVPDNAKIGLIFSETDIIYPFQEENPTWKIYPVRFEKFIAEKRFDQYDFLIAARDMQSVYTLRDDIKFDYYFDLDEKKLVFKDKDDEAKTFYANHHGKIVFDKTVHPERFVNLIEEKKLSKYFELIKKISINSSRKTYDIVYWIYRKRDVKNEIN